MLKKGNIISKIFGVYPHAGLLFTTEFVPILIAVIALMDWMIIHYHNIHLSYGSLSFGLLAIYAAAVAFVKLFNALAFIFKLDKNNYITKVIEEMQEK